MPTPNRHPQRGNVLVLTMFALIPLLGFLGLAVDLGYMFNYKLRAQIAADAAALAAALTPYNPDLSPDHLVPQKIAARDIAVYNGFKDGVATTVVDVNTPPLQGDFMESEPGTYFEADIRQDLPTYFMSAVGVTSFPIHVRAVAKSSITQGPCLTVGDARFSGNTRLHGEACELWFNSVSVVGEGAKIWAYSTNLADTIFQEPIKVIAQPNPPPPPVDVFPTFSGGESINSCPGSGMVPGTYKSIEIRNGCTFESGVYNVSEKLDLSGTKSNPIQGDKLIFLLKGGVMAEFGGTVQLTAGAQDYEKFILWAQAGIALAGFTNEQDLLNRSNRTLTFAHDPGLGANRLLLVSVVTGATSNTASDAPTITGVTFAREEMTLVESTVESGVVKTYLYQYVNPPSGSANVVVSASGPTASGLTAPIYAAATTYNNVNQDTPLGAVNAVNLPGDESITVTLDSGDKELVHAVVGIDADGTAVEIVDRQSNVATNTNKTRISSAISNKPDDTVEANTNMAWSWSGAQAASVIAVPIKPQEGGYIHFAPNASPKIDGHLYAPGVPFELGGEHFLKPDSTNVMKPGLAE